MPQYFRLYKSQNGSKIVIDGTHMPRREQYEWMYLETVLLPDEQTARQVAEAIVKINNMDESKTLSIVVKRK